MTEPEITTESARLEAVARGAYFGCLSEISRGLVHDLNGALNTLSLNVELLDIATSNGEGAGNDGAARARSLASARGAVREIRDIVARQLLPVGRIAESGSIDANTLLADLLDEVTPILHLRRARLTLDPSPGPLTVRCAAPAVRRTWLVTVCALLDGLGADASLRFSARTEGDEVRFGLSAGGERALDSPERAALLARLLAELPELPELWQGLGGTFRVLPSGPDLIRFGLPLAPPGAR